MNGKQEEKLQQLLKLKRLESPGQPYFDHFLAEFHRYQRAELIAEPSRWERFKEQLGQVFNLLSGRSLVYSSSFAALFLLATIGLFAPQGGNAPAIPLVSQYSSSSLSGSTEATEEALRQIEVQPVSLSAFDRDFNAPRFVTGERTLAYENTVAF